MAVDSTSVEVIGLAAQPILRLKLILFDCQLKKDRSVSVRSIQNLPVDLSAGFLAR